MAKRTGKASPSTKSTFNVKAAVYKRFEEIMATAESRVAAIQLETQGRINEWGLMAKKTAGVPKGLMDKVAYDQEQHRFVVQKPTEEPASEDDQGDS